MLPVIEGEQIFFCAHMPTWQILSNQQENIRMTFFGYPTLTLEIELHETIFEMKLDLKNFEIWRAWTMLGDMDTLTIHIYGDNLKYVQTEQIPLGVQTKDAMKEVALRVIGS